MAQIWGNLGSAYGSKGEWDRAIGYFAQALPTLAQLGDIHGMAATYNNLGLAYQSKGEWDRAIGYYKQALQTFEQLGDLHGMAGTYGNLGWFYHQQNQQAEAAHYMTQAFVILSQLGAAPEARQTGGLLVQIFGSPEAAQSYVNEFLAAMNSESTE
jgi:tetratricopeptide (TPR) repeat protein